MHDLVPDVADGRARFTAMRRSRRLILVAAALALIAGAATFLVANKPSAHAAQGDRHFIHIATHASPLWKAHAELYAGDGTQVYTWSTHGIKSGGRELWYFTDGGDNGWVNVTVTGKTAHGDDPMHTEKLPLDRDHCFIVSSIGETTYTGDSLTGGCTSYGASDSS